MNPIENNTDERHYFGLLKSVRNGEGAAAYRRAVQACTGSLPTWAQRKRPGPARRQAVDGTAEPATQTSNNEGQE